MQEETISLNWSTECKDITLGYFKLCESALNSNKDKLSNKESFLLAQIAASCQRATESSVLLVGSCYLWEAEVLIRATIEGTVKYIYLCTGSEGDRIKKAMEYWDDLPNLYQIRQHTKATEWLSQVDNPKDQKWKPIRDLILDPEELSLLQSKYPRQVLKRLEGKWSINSIMQSIRGYNQDIYQALCGIVFGYDIASHITHQDADCIGLMWDRINRELPRRQAVEKAHAARELHDLITSAQNRATITRHMFRMDMKPIIALHKSHESLFLELEKAKSDWYQIEYTD